jgi:hypothetical protein
MKSRLVIRSGPYKESPAWWRRFHRTHADWRSDPWVHIHRTIEEFNGHLVYHAGNHGVHYIDFDDEKSMTFFVLRWT